MSVTCIMPHARSPQTLLVHWAPRWAVVHRLRGHVAARSTLLLGPCSLGHAGVAPLLLAGEGTWHARVAPLLLWVAWISPLLLWRKSSRLAARVAALLGRETPGLTTRVTPLLCTRLAREAALLLLLLLGWWGCRSTWLPRVHGRCGVKGPGGLHALLGRCYGRCTGQRHLHGLRGDSGMPPGGGLRVGDVLGGGHVDGHGHLELDIRHKGTCAQVDDEVVLARDKLALRGGNELGRQRNGQQLALRTHEGGVGAQAREACFGQLVIQLPHGGTISVQAQAAPQVQVNGPELSSAVVLNLQDHCRHLPGHVAVLLHVGNHTACAIAAAAARVDGLRVLYTDLTRGLEQPLVHKHLLLVANVGLQHAGHDTLGLDLVLDLGLGVVVVAGSIAVVVVGILEGPRQAHGQDKGEGELVLARLAVLRVAIQGHCHGEELPVTIAGDDLNPCVPLLPL
mmetsp:Transcript_25051/g.54472  ORF Transcript_25051/g.54472 Transcript_25051/m.54472 type:complete len:453 (+) Transcript_25051:550-1908(+)